MAISGRFNSVTAGRLREMAPSKRHYLVNLTHLRTVEIIPVYVVVVAHSLHHQSIVESVAEVR